MSTDDKITQAAAEAFYAEERNNSMGDPWPEWDDLGEAGQGAYREVMREVLAAVRPLIEAAALREAAARLYPVPAADRLSAMADAKEAGR